MHEKQIVTIIGFGIGLIAIGLIPGPLALIKEELQNFRGAFSEIPTNRQRDAEKPQWLPGQHWIAVVGIVMVTLGLLALLTN